MSSEDISAGAENRTVRDAARFRRSCAATVQSEAVRAPPLGRRRAPRAPAAVALLIGTAAAAGAPPPPAPRGARASLIPPRSRSRAPVIRPPLTTRPPSPSPQLFFARTPHSNTENDVKGLFSTFGRVEAVKCFRPGGGQQVAGVALATKGCGLVKMSSAAEAEAAIKGLHETFTWSGMPGPMVGAGGAGRAAAAVGCVMSAVMQQVAGCTQVHMCTIQATMAAY
jgi:hypothetical protein